MVFSHVTLEGIIFRASGGEIVKPLPEPVQSNARNAQWDRKTLTLTYEVPAETEDEEPTRHTLTLTQAVIDAAAAWQPDPEPAAVPESVTKLQMTLALIEAGYAESIADLEAQIDAAISLATTPGIEREMARARWQAATIIEYGNPLLNAIAAAEELDKDQLFRRAAEL